MSHRYRVAVVGTAHSHITTLTDYFNAMPESFEIVAAADVPPLVPSISREPGTRYACLDYIVKKTGATLYEDYHALLKTEQPEIVIMCCENAFHGRVGEEILASGAHLVMEKPFASSMKDALRIVRAAEAAGKRVIVNWPSTWNPGIRTAQKLAVSGEIGKVFKVTYRNSDSLGALSYGQVITDAEKGAEWWHQSAAGGGALLDYCCYGACLSSWIFGEAPLSAFAIKANFDSPYGDAEDYAQITAQFPGGVGLIEGSWTTLNTGVPSGPVIFGTKGTIVADYDEVRVYKTRHKREPDAVITPDPLPKGRATLAEDVLNTLEMGEALHPTLDLEVNLRAMSILDAGIRSAASGRREQTNGTVWTV